MKIEEALKRIEESPNGVCELTGKKHPRARLERSMDAVHGDAQGN